VFVISAQDIGDVVRERRQQLRLSQAQLAEAAGVSRRWLLALETGKPTAQLDLVFRALHALGLILDAVEEPPGETDLDALIDAHRSRRDG
jgi:HTH-type transcriptional regulator / antitoxin HipB